MSSEMPPKDVHQQAARLAYLLRNAAAACDGGQLDLALDFTIEVYRNMLALAQDETETGSEPRFDGADAESLAIDLRRLEKMAEGTANIGIIREHVESAGRLVEKLSPLQARSTGKTLGSSATRFFGEIGEKISWVKSLDAAWLARAEKIAAGLAILVLLTAALTYFFQRKQGLTGEYFLDEHLGSRYFIKRDRSINFDWGTAGISGKYCNYFSIRWTGFLRAPVDGKYGIKLRVDDGGRVYIDGKIVLDDWNSHNARESTAFVNLTRGYHAISVEYFERAGYASVFLSWQKPGDRGYAIIEPSYFVPRQEDLPEAPVSQ